MTITCVPRLVASLGADAAPPLGAAVWRDTRIELPRLHGHEAGGPPPFRNIFTGDTVGVDFDGRTLSIAAATLFERFPVAVLVPCST
jgi:maltooligosyltrehalose synthase